MPSAIHPILLRLAAALALASSTLAGPPQPSPFAFYERSIAIDGACAWPSVHVLPDGRLVALIWPLDVHGKVEGAVEAWVSTDHGVKWRRGSVPVPAAPGTNRFNVAGGVIDGRLLALVGGFGPNRPPYAPDARFWNREQPLASPALPPVAVRAADPTGPWERLGELTHTARTGAKGYKIPYGRMEELPDGSIGAMLYGHGLEFHTSADGGTTWIRRGTLAPHDPALPYGCAYNETTWIRLENGDLYAAARSFPLPEYLGGTNLDGFRSTDGGVTWTREQALALPNQIPADLMRMPDGTLLLTYASRNAGSRAIWLRFGSRDARQWSAPTLLVDLEGSTESQYPDASPDGGYPSTVLAADGTYVTAYYSRGVPAHQRYHMGVVRWRLQDGPPTRYTR